MAELPVGTPIWNATHEWPIFHGGTSVLVDLDASQMKEGAPSKVVCAGPCMYKSALLAETFETLKPRNLETFLLLHSA